jgi:hypothetical protein
MTQRLKLRDVIGRLPDDCAAWIRAVKPAYQEGVETILNNTGLENIAKHWQTHKEDLAYLRETFGEFA